MKNILFTLLLFLFSNLIYPQCTPTGDQISYGNNSWIGYVYDARENFNNSNYVGYITENEIFNETFSTGITTTSCSTDPSTFTIRFKMNKTFSCGSYDLTIGGDDGVRLSLDGGLTWVINEWQPQSYRTFSRTVFLSGNYDMVLEFYEAYGDEQVSFSYTYLDSTSSGGMIGDDQEYCGNNPTFDPSIINSVTDGGFCNGVTNYQWEVSSDNINFQPILGSNNPSYDPPIMDTDTIVYYRRKVSNNIDSNYSNIVQVISNSVPGDPSVYGNDEWIGYFYEGKDNFTDYRGYVIEQGRFDQSFGGSTNNLSINGCDVYTETYTVRYKMRKTFTNGVYEFTVGADDGVRLSLDGGVTWLIDDYSDHGYRTTTKSDTLSGTYDMVLDYYENGGGNRISFTYNELSPLPVDLILFEAELKNDYVELMWITTSEINNNYFELQKSIDGKTFFVIDKVMGNGTTNMRQIYESYDDDVEELCYYRLTQTDFDGKKTEYNPIIFENEDDQKQINIYPNPVKDKVTIEIPKTDNKIDLFVNDLYGNEHINDILVIELNDKTIINLTFNENVPTGVYIISFLYNGEMISEKLFIE
jgi:hypothetical protein